MELGARHEERLEPAERRRAGVFYTTDVHVRRVLGPLFLDALEDELGTARTAEELLGLQERIAGLKLLDPAAGAGNFLIVAYRSLRRIEGEILLRLGAGGPLDCRVRLGQLFGIEIDAAAAEVCRDALYAAERLEDEALRERVGEASLRLAERSAPTIAVRNALRCDWGEVLPASEASFVFGNPPFVGMSRMSGAQREDARRAFGEVDARDLRTGRLDYAAGWIAKALRYGKDRPLRFAFVVTNSLTQGEQARSLGPLLSRHSFLIDFAWRTFPWRSERPGDANVHVVVLGFSNMPRAKRAIYGASEIQAKSINIWLADAPDVALAKRFFPFRNYLPVATKGSQPTDGGFLIIDPEDYDEVMADPIARRFVRPYLQAKEFLKNKKRYCLWLVGASEEELGGSALLQKRLEGVRRVRLGSRTRGVRAQADTPALFTQIRQPTARYLALPEVSSVNRRWIPAAFLDPEVIAGNKLIMFPDADLWLFGMLQSSMFMAWVRAVAGRMKSDISISPHLTYCTFPFPEPSGDVESAARHMLEVRNLHAGSSLDKLYSPTSMPGDLLEAHAGLDRAVDASFSPNVTFGDDADRLAVLFEAYRRLT